MMRVFYDQQEELYKLRKERKLYLQRSSKQFLPYNYYEGRHAQNTNSTLNEYNEEDPMDILESPNNPTNIEPATTIGGTMVAPYHSKKKFKSQDNTKFNNYAPSIEPKMSGSRYIDMNPHHISSLRNDKLNIDLSDFST